MSEDAVHVGAAVERTKAAYARGDYSSAAANALEWVGAHGLPPVPLATPLAKALRALGRYSEARRVLQAARRTATDASERSDVLAEQAELAWVLRDHAEGLELAVAALRIDPSNRRAQTVRDRCAFGMEIDARPIAARTFAHAAFSVSAHGNFGDVVVPIAVREAFESVERPAEWLPIHVHQVFDEETLERVQQTERLIVGGGGLFLSDTAPNPFSGWQWNVTSDRIRRLGVPLAIFGVGYNVFPGQERLGEAFDASILAVAETARLIGLRNHGSIERVRDHLPPSLRERVTYVPCPTTLLSRTHSLPPRHETGAAPVVYLNAAYDRAALRFGVGAETAGAPGGETGRGYGEFLEQIARYVRRVRDAGAEVRIASHLPADDALAKDLRSSHDLTVPIDAMYDLTLDDALARYRDAALVVGMRGHAGMIPFGVGTPILSLVSHPKLQYFLDDIGRPEWGFSVASPTLADDLAASTLDILERQGAYRADIRSIQDALEEITRTSVQAFLA